MDFRNAAELLDLCNKNQMQISDVMKQRECSLGETTIDTINDRMQHVLDVMRQSAAAAVKNPRKSMGDLIGGEAKRLSVHRAKGKDICGNILGKGLTYAMGILEVNASMGLIVAAPTAGSSGIVPGLLLALQEEYHISDERLVDALFNAGAIGYLAMRNATVAGAAGTVLMNMLGLVCDPVSGLVEYPCQNRNASGVANALIAAEIALSGIGQLIPLDEMIAAMYSVGKRMPAELRETALGGCAATPTGCGLCSGCDQ